MKINMGIEKSMQARLSRPIRSDLDALYRELYDGMPGPPMSAFIGFVLGEGMAAMKSQWSTRKWGPRKRRR